MIHVQVKATVPGRSGAELYPLLSDMSTYSSCVDAVRSIVVSEENGLHYSTWEVDFHGGIMRWKEEDTFFPEEHAIKFHQVQGDVDYFSGEWRMIDQDGGCVIDFSADFDLGLSGLSELLEPIADSALRENVRGILGELLGATEFA